MSPHQHNGVDALAGASGLRPEEVRSIWEAVKANGRLLDACEGPHEFVLDDPAAPINRREHRCTRCGGTVDGVARKWYEDGLKHARSERETP